MSPLANAYIDADSTHLMEPFYPLHAYVCEVCFLVQLPELESPENIFREYAYFSSYSDSWLSHVEKYADSIVERFGFDASSQVIEIGSNDGCMLMCFKQKGIPVLGVEPAVNVAKTAREKGIPTITEFFGVGTAQSLARGGVRGDLLLGNNVLAHVPDLNDFVAGLKIVLKPDGIITMEFPHLLKLMQNNQFDTIYHEHFSYFSFSTVDKIFETHALKIFDVEELTTHGGSLRIFAKHIENKKRDVVKSVADIKSREENASLDKIDTYFTFAEQVRETKRALLDFLIDAKRNGKKIVGYGAPAKGNTLLNYCGIRQDFVSYIVDRSPHKQGRYLPGTHIPIYAPEKVLETKPDYLLILPWNIKDEIIGQMAHIREWGGRFVVPIPFTETLA